MKAEIGKRIRALRKALKLSRDVFSEIMDISPSYLGLVERGERCLGLAKLVKLKGIFNITLDYLVEGHAENSPHLQSGFTDNAGSAADNGKGQPLSPFTDIIRDIALFNLSAGEIELLSEAMQFHMNVIVRARALYKGSA